MSVKAKAEITLASIAEVKAVYRYYLLQASTLQPPEKPTIYPPLSPWDDTEPTYQGGTNSLYIVDVTILSDDKFIYSNVSLSSSYEAAKAAWNKAANAENMAENADKLYIGATAPTNTTKVWCDTSVSPPVIKHWSNEHWEIVNDQNETLSKIERLRLDTATLIDQQIKSIRFVVGENEQYTIDEYTSLITSRLNQITQTASDLTINFQNFIATEFNDLVQNTDEKFAERNSYIRFSDDPVVNGDGGPTIYIGIEGNPLILRMRNNKISFLQNGTEVAYISNSRMYITDAEITHSIAIGGKFRWVYEDNGSLSLE